MKRTLHKMALLTLALVFIAIPAASAKVVVPQFDSANFGTPQDNTYLPMAVGKTYRYEAEEEDGLVIGEIVNTGDTKEILGVTCMVITDVETIEVEGEDDPITLEATFDWYAWDNEGNVWYFGEDTIAYEYDDDWNLIETSTEGSWQAGVDGAEPGILMLADPRPGLSYRQEYYEGQAEDMAKVLRLNAKVSVEYGDFDNCLVTKEWTALDRGVIEHKYYAPGIGLVYVEELKGKTVHVELVQIN